MTLNSLELGFIVGNQTMSRLISHQTLFLSIFQSRLYPSLVQTIYPSLPSLVQTTSFSNPDYIYPCFPSLIQTILPSLVQTIYFLLQSMCYILSFLL